MKTGVLLLNLGSPESPEEPEVRKYLGEFLMDPYVIDIPAIMRWILVKGIILRTRPKKSAEAYRLIWTKRGSPLIFHTLDLAEKVQTDLGEGFSVRAVMRYGTPSVGEAVASFVKEGVKRIVALPLYPQEAGATSVSSRKWVKAEVDRLGFKGELRFVPRFFDRAEWIEVFAARVQESLRDFAADRVLFSFHGLPERQIKKAETTKGFCLSFEGCCAVLNDKNKGCYRAQCFASARAIAQAADLDEDRIDVAFQSRLGSTPWIQPFTDEKLAHYVRDGVKKVLLLSPSFVADCLETLEELGIRAKGDFERSGGELRLVECPNASQGWAQAVASLVREACVHH